MILEVCVDSTASALAAKRGGADRLELCADLIVGGTTPSLALVRQVKAETGLPVRALLRPRFGDFCYDRYELAQMEQLAAELVAAGADGIVTGALTPEGDLEDALVHMQWIGMEYATIRQAVFLRWQKDGRGSLPYETLRDYMVVISRMTGYEEDDIREYLENSFEELLWEWGYFALITGK